LVGIEHTFPYGHPEHRPPAPADVAALADIDPATMSAAQLNSVIDGLEGARRQLDATYLAVVGEFEHRGVHHAEGAVSASSALEHRHGRDGRQLRREATVAAKLRRLPLAAKTLAAGRITADHVEVLTRAMTSRTHDAVVADEPRLVAMAEGLDVDRYRRALRHWKAHADPDGTDPGDGSPSEWTMSTSIGGTAFSRGRFGSEAGATIGRAVAAMLDELHRDGDPDTDSAPIAQRRADALVELCRRGANLTPDDAPIRRTRPQIVVTIDHDNLLHGIGVGETDTGHDLSATAVRRLACDAEIIAAVFATDSELLDLGRRARLVSPAQRLALVMRDRGCAFPSCDRPPGWCDAHHIDHWIHGGPTDLDNLVLLCSRHHHLLHEGGWTVRRSAARLEFTGPDGRIAPDRPPTPGRPDPWLHDPPGPEPPARGAPLG
jgi:hypothetical protein